MKPACSLLTSDVIEPSATNLTRCCYNGQKPGPLENKILSCVCPVCWAGRAQGDYSGRLGRSGLTGRRARARKDRQHTCRVEGADREADRSEERVAVLLRSRAVWLWHPTPTECDGLRMCRGCAVVDPPQTWRSDQNGPPRCAQPCQTAPRR